ncbi:large ribosomal subunit protein uL18B-like [Corticium candelabrum]|uniref:large ribosomal subunit protein uL18B-like n=1 Tax=Corticium candelabrum TaxID=121492 RepID=UPI002E259532|nr:large ribosomal subunit protein uL18B-like [Corticium candelabrum]
MNVAKRKFQVLTKLGLAEHYQGVDEVSGEEYHVEEVDGAPGPFRCFLDIRLARTTTGARVFRALKGAVDGGLDVPHSVKSFPGYDAETKEYDAEVHRGHSFGQHVANYMTHLEENDEDAYRRQFSRYIKEGIAGNTLEDKYKAIHAAIREDPSHKPAPSKDVTPKRWNRAKMSLAQRRDRIRQKKEAFLKRQAADGEDND